MASLHLTFNLNNAWDIYGRINIRDKDMTTS